MSSFHVISPAKVPSRMVALLSPLLSSPGNRVVLSIRAPTLLSTRLLPQKSTAVSPATSFSCSYSLGGCGLGSFSNPYTSFNSSGGSSRKQPMTTVNASSATAPAAARSVHDFTVKDINGEDVDLSTYKGKVLLIVNVASACGLTNSNYKELAEVYSDLKQAGLEILAFPCNQFGAQEPGSREQIKEFACTRFKAEYPIFDKVDVNGPNTAPVYQFLKASKGGGILGDSIKWNFGKFLVDQDGIVVERYAPTTSPKKIQGDIKKLLGV